MSEAAAWRAAETAARTSYGKLVAILSARSRDVAAAEDALSQALADALAAWPRTGVPRRPEAWLLTAARNRLANRARHEKVRAGAQAEIERQIAEHGEDGPSPFGDERLKLMFVCAHPAIDRQVRSALMLQTVLGLEAVRISQAFLMSPAAMGQRLVRAKAKIRDAGISFALPEPEQLPARLSDVLDAIYAAFGTGFDTLEGADETGAGLAAEAIYLCRLVVTLLPGEPEAKGLLALMLHSEARRAARRDGNGLFVPLDRQDAQLWNRNMIEEAERLLVEAARARRFGRYQCEAAIQSVHAQRPIIGATNLSALETLYDMLVRFSPSAGAVVSRAAVIGQLRGAAAGLASLDTDADELFSDYQPYWVVRARFARELDDPMAASFLERAIGLTRDPALRRHLLAERLAATTQNRG